MLNKVRGDERVWCRLHLSNMFVCEVLALVFSFSTLA
jgi:hypothetical protein